jgi:hypothetical protein
MGMARRSAIYGFSLYIKDVDGYIKDVDGYIKDVDGYIKDVDGGAPPRHDGSTALPMGPGLGRMILLIRELTRHNHRALR